MTSKKKKTNVVPMQAKVEPEEIETEEEEEAQPEETPEERFQKRLDALRQAKAPEENQTPVFKERASEQRPLMNHAFKLANRITKSALERNASGSLRFCASGSATNQRERN